MSTLTITLEPELAALLRSEARRRGKDEQQLARELIAAELVAGAAPGRFPELAPDVRALLDRMSDAEMLVPPQRSAAEASRLLEAWSNEDAGGGEDSEAEGWDDILRAIDASRMSQRKLFPDGDPSV